MLSAHCWQKGSSYPRGPVFAPFLESLSLHLFALPPSLTRARRRHGRTVYVGMARLRKNDCFILFDRRLAVTVSKLASCVLSDRKTTISGSRRDRRLRRHCGILGSCSRGDPVDAKKTQFLLCFFFQQRKAITHRSNLLGVP